MLIDEKQPDFKEILKDLWAMDRIDIAFDGNSEYVESRDKLINLLTNDVEQANNLIDALNFDNPIESHILRFVPEIVENFGNPEEQQTFISHFDSLKERFPNVNFSPALFYAKLSCDS